MAANSRLPRPFRYRGRWRAQVSLPNGTRPARNFDTIEEAKAWIAEQMQRDTTHAPALGGPTRATVADALTLYAQRYTLAKGGCDAELGRINRYLHGAGRPLLRCVTDGDGARTLVELPHERRPPRGCERHLAERRTKRAGTYAAMQALAGKECSRIEPLDIRSLMTQMSSDGLTPSTIQKEIALLRHMFAMAAKEWSWQGFVNPTAGMRLGHSTSRFVALSEPNRQALWQALSECDNPYVWPLVSCAIATTLRRSSLLAMRWDKLDLDGRTLQVPTKTGVMTLPLAQPAVDVLRGLPRHPSGYVFPLSANAVDLAWDGVRRKAGLPTLQFRDLRHLGATMYARLGLRTHQLQRVLGHKTAHMAEVYVNLVHEDVLDALDAATVNTCIVEVPPAVDSDAGGIVRQRRAQRLARAIRSTLQGVATSHIGNRNTADPCPSVDKTQSERAPHAGVVIEFPRRRSA